MLEWEVTILHPVRRTLVAKGEGELGALVGWLLSRDYDFQVIRMVD